MGFINEDDPTENLIDEEEGDYSSSPSFEVVEEVKVNHGMLVSTRQVADTFFHQIVPSQTLKVHLNPVTVAHNHSIHNTETCTVSNNFFRNLKECVMGKLIMKPSKTIASVIMFMFAILLMNWVCSDSEDTVKQRSWMKRMIRECGAEKMMKWNNDEKEKVWFVGIKTGKGFSEVLKKIGIFLTISFALCSLYHVG